MVNKSINVKLFQPPEMFDEAIKITDPFAIDIYAVGIILWQVEVG